MTRRVICIVVTVAALSLAVLSSACGQEQISEQPSSAELVRSAEQGDADAQFNLGDRYRTGRGVPQDESEAVHWYSLAADQGNEDARKLRDTLAEAISAGQIAAAQQSERDRRRVPQAAPGSTVAATSATAATSPTETPCIPTELSPASVELVRLYEELHTFVNDPLFGFGWRYGPYFAWLQTIKKHRDTRYEMLDELGFQPNEVMMLGMNYASTFSESTRRAIEYFERKIQAGLASARCTEPGLEWQEILQAASEVRLSYSEATHQEAVAKHLSTNLSVENYLTEEVRGQVLRLERAIDVGEADGRAVLALLEAPPELPILTTEEQASVDNWRSSLRQRLELNMASFLGLRESIRELRELRGAPN